MIFVAVAMFEYALLLTIKFGKQNKISSMNTDEEEKALERCRKIDLYVLRAFIVAYILALCTYFSLYLLLL